MERGPVEPEQVDRLAEQVRVPRAARGVGARHDPRQEVAHPGVLRGDEPSEAVDAEIGVGGDLRDDAIEFGGRHARSLGGPVP